MRHRVQGSGQNYKIKDKSKMTKVLKFPSPEGLGVGFK
jgi:hypothetical protein